MTHLRPGRLALRFLAVSGVALATANCASNTATKFAATGNGVDPKYGVKASPRLYNEGDTIPKGGGRRYTGKPYVVAGQTYAPRENPAGYVREGLASWYGSAFHGRMTANGEVFDRHSIAAAHPTLPLPSYVRVTNLENHSSMIVRVNDRGPYHAGRVMDVSEETAEALGFHRGGTARVRVEYVGKASLAGSDDRKLLATLRTDGQPAGSRSAVMVADLGPVEETEKFSRGATPLAYKPAPERDEAPRRPRAAPSARRSCWRAPPSPCRPPCSPPPAARRSSSRRRSRRRRSSSPRSRWRRSPSPAANPAAHASAKVAAAPATRLASAAPEPHRPAGRGAPAAMPASAKLAMAQLSAKAAPAVVKESGKGSAKPVVKQAAKAPEPPARSGGHGTRYAGIY